jgi:DNA gyrase subunit A
LDEQEEEKLDIVEGMEGEGSDQIQEDGSENPGTAAAETTEEETPAE